MTKFSVRFKKMRNEIGVSQEELANIMGCSRTKITAYEKNEPDFVEFFSKLHNDYGVDLNLLFTGKSTQKEPENFRLEVKQAIKDLIKTGELSKNDFV